MLIELCSRRLQEVDKADGFDDLGKVKWELALSLLVVFVFVYFALWKGIKSSGKVSIIIELFLIIFIFIRLSGLLLLLHMQSYSFY
jgi:hypothetical protein